MTSIKELCDAALEMEDEYQQLKDASGWYAEVLKTRDDRIVELKKQLETPADSMMHTSDGRMISPAEAYDQKEKECEALRVENRSLQGQLKLESSGGLLTHKEPELMLLEQKKAECNRLTLAMRAQQALTNRVRILTDFIDDLIDNNVKIPDIRDRAIQASRGYEGKCPIPKDTHGGIGA